MAQDGNKVVWFEGMTLDPHHFQQWDRYRERVLQTRLQAIAPMGWGLLDLEIDEDRLANGEMALRSCAAVLPDGCVVDVPEASPLPDVRSVQEHFPATEDRIRAFLAVPSERPGGRNVQLQGTTPRQDTRYAAESVAVNDDTTGANERPVEIARTNVHLRFADEPRQGYTLLPIAELVRSGGGFALNTRFVPPSLQLQASRRLKALTRQVVELLTTKSLALTERHKDARAQRELSPPDILALSILGAINGALPALNQHLETGRVHPALLFERLAGLAGRLATYVENAPVHPRDLPTYDHAAPTDAFGRLEEVLTQMLGEEAPATNYQRIGLTQKRETLKTASVPAPQLREAQLFLVTRSEQHTEEELTDRLPNMLRIASPNTIDAVLQSYTRALSVSATRRLPVGMPVDNQATYFRLEKRGPFWDSILEEEGVAIFIPAEFTDVRLELIAAR
jgi:type VI secretion system protein ImpJ